MERIRTLMVHRDAAGYGLILSGDQPVSVQTVRPGGAAERAGIRHRDIIVKVNGIRVSEFSHSEVVKLIQGRRCVEICVVQPIASADINADPVSNFIDEGADSAYSFPVGSPYYSNELKPMLPPSAPFVPSVTNLKSLPVVTAPLPATASTAIALASEKIYILELMIEHERRHCDQIRQNLAVNFSKKIQLELDANVKRLVILEQQLSTLKSEKWIKSKEIDVSGVDDDCHSSSVAVQPRVSEIQVSPPPLPPANRRSCSMLPYDPEPPIPPPRPSTSRLLPPPPNIPLPFPPSNSTASESSRATSFFDRLIDTTPRTATKLSVHHKHICPTDDITLDKINRLRTPSPRYETPPGTPPPPYGGSHNFIEEEVEGFRCKLEPDRGLVLWSDLIGGQDATAIISVEDEEERLSDEAALLPKTSSSVVVSDMATTAFPNPFRDLSELFGRQAELAVFLNYVISNSEPAALLFYLITDLYKLGKLAEMQRWAYEIYSSFLIPGSPICIPDLDLPDVVQKISKVLEEDSEKEDVMRKLFWKPRMRARVILKEQLVQFIEKRSSGLAGIFGPSDHELAFCLDNRAKQLQIIDDVLVPILGNLTLDLVNASSRSMIIAAALASVLGKTFNLRTHGALTLIDKCPSFVSKEKRVRRFGRNKKNIYVKGHQFELKGYYQVSYCNHSQQIIWGIAPQGYHCANCGFDVLRKFVHDVEETCGLSGISFPLSSTIASASKKNSSAGQHTQSHVQRRGVRGVSVFGKILSDSPSNVMNRKSIAGITSLGITGYEEKPLLDLDSNTITGQKEVRSNLDDEACEQEDYPAPNIPPPPAPLDLKNSSFLPQIEKEAEHKETSRRNISKKVGRAHSCRLENENIDNSLALRVKEPRKHSDPNLCRQRDEIENALISNQTSECSSLTGSSSRSLLESPAGSLTQIGASTKLTSSTSDSVWSRHSLRDLPDYDIESDVPYWRHCVDPTILGRMSDIDKKRQDVICEIIWTEQSHLRNLQILDRIYYRPLLETSFIPREDVMKLFPQFDALIQVHSKYTNLLMERFEQDLPVTRIGDILNQMFNGDTGSHLIQIAAEFIREQTMTIEKLKEFRMKDPNFDNFLFNQERLPECRRLDLLGFLPMEHQRLVKYPMMLKEMSKHCQPSSAADSENSDSQEEVLKLCERTKEILSTINRHVANHQNIYRLAEIQKNLDTSGLEKDLNSSLFNEFRHVDLTSYRLVHDGPLQLRTGDSRRYRTIELHALLLEHCLILLQKQEGKYLLKAHTIVTQDVKKINSPVIKFSNIIVRPVATDKRAFYLLNNTTQGGPQIYELVAPCSADRAQWFRHIADTSKSHKPFETRRLGGFHASESIVLGDVGGNYTVSSSQNGIGLLENSASILESNIDKHLVVPPFAGPRSHSFHETSLSAAQPKNLLDTAGLHKSEERALNVDPDNWSTPKTDNGAISVSKMQQTSSNKTRQRFERLRRNVAAAPSKIQKGLIDPSQVRVTLDKVYVADALNTASSDTASKLSIIEQILLKDVEISNAILEKQHLLYELLPAEQQINNDQKKDTTVNSNLDAKQLLLSALIQANSLSELANSSLSKWLFASNHESISSSSSCVLESELAAGVAVTATTLTPESTPSPASAFTLRTPPPCSQFSNSTPLHGLPSPPGTSVSQLVQITVNINNQLTSLLDQMQKHEDETEILREKLRLSEEHVQSLLKNLSPPIPARASISEMMSVSKSDTHLHLIDDDISTVENRSNENAIKQKNDDDANKVDVIKDMFIHMSDCEDLDDDVSPNSDLMTSMLAIHDSNNK